MEGHAGSSAGATKIMSVKNVPQQRQYYSHPHTAPLTGHALLVTPPGASHHPTPMHMVPRAEFMGLPQAPAATSPPRQPPPQLSALGAVTKSGMIVNHPAIQGVGIPAPVVQNGGFTG